MLIGSKEHEDIIKAFERQYSYLRLDKEKNKELWKYFVYENGEANELFKAYRNGYSLAKNTYQV